MFSTHKAVPSNIGLFRLEFLLAYLQSWLGERHSDPCVPFSGRWLNTDLRCANLSDVTKGDDDAGGGMDSLCERHPLLLWPSRSAATMQMSVCADTKDRYVRHPVIVQCVG